MGLTQEMAAVGSPPDAPGSDAAARLSAALAGRYKVIRELGRGGMATVYLAQDLKHDREVAIKVLHPELAASIGGERFEREIKLAAKLQHPNILGLYDSGSGEGLLYYVMPFVKGESLRDRLDRDGQLPVDDAVRIVLQVADALGYAHSQGIIHRDIKPENILLSGDHALVADFGIARAITEGGVQQKLTATGMSMGTPFYMAPEQAGGETVGPTADLYSLGCVLYELLAGEPPFTGKNSMAIMARHAMEQVPSVRIVRSSVPEEIEQAIYAAMGKVPADRPQTAAQFVDLLGMSLSATATLRVLGATATRRTPTPITSGPLLRMTTAGDAEMIRLPTPAELAAMVKAQRPWWRRPAALAMTAAVLIAVIAGGWKVMHARQGATGIDPNARRVAVLYFSDLSKDHSLGPLADGLTEDLIRALSSARSITVISQSGVQAFRGSTLGVDSIADRLRAGYLVRGEVEPDGADVRVSVRLSYASGANVGSTSFTQPAGNLLAMRDTLARRAADLIRKQLGQEIQTAEQRASTSNAGAWLLAQRAEQSRKSAEADAAKGDLAAMGSDFDAADTLAAAAERTDPGWTAPTVLRAGVAYRRSRLPPRDPPSMRKWIDVGMGHVERALQRDPKDADALELRGNLQYWSYLMNLEPDPARRNAQLMAAKADLENATTINPAQAGAYASLSHLYYRTGTPTDVNIAAQRAYDADEFLSNANDVLWRLFLSSYDLAQADKADHWCSEVRRRFPAHLRAVRCQLYLLTDKSTTPDVARAWRLADSAVALTAPPQQAVERFTEDLLVAAVIARASATTPALKDSARHVVHRSEGDARIDPTRDLAHAAAFAYTILGDKADAIRMLKEYIAINTEQAATLRADPGWWFKDLQTDPEFRRLVGAQ